VSGSTDSDLARSVVGGIVVVLSEHSCYRMASTGYIEETQTFGPRHAMSEEVSCRRSYAEGEVAPVEASAC
jgi:hypothetical protein